MALSQPSSLFQKLRKVVCGPEGGDLTDGQLLQLFIDQHDEAAFAALVRRHGPMVLGVCRRLLHQEHDAEDAFQATFLVLVRKADSIVPRDLVGNWLYGVAYRTAQKAKTLSVRRQMKERQVQAMPQPEPARDEMWQDLRPLLDQELHRLPDKYRVPVVLCDLEGKSRKEAARQLGWPEGTLSWRLSSARTMLAKRLTRHGLAFSAGSLALVLSQKASACVPAPLMVSTIQAATLSAAGPVLATGLISTQVAALTEGVLQTMWLIRLKLTLAVALAMTVLGTGVGVVSYRTLAVPPDQVQAGESFQAEDRLSVPERLEDDAAVAEERQRDADAERQRDARKGVAVDGRVAAISNDGKVLTLESGGRGEDVKKVDIKITDQTKVEFGGVLKELGYKLKMGDSATVFLQEGSKDTAAAVLAYRGPDLTAKIALVSPDEKLLTLEVPSRARGEAPAKIEIKLTDKTKLGSGRGEATKLQVGHVASVWLVEGSKDTAAALQSSRPQPNAYGTISALSADGKVLTVDSKNRAGEVTKTEIKLADATKLEFVGGEPTNKKLKVGNLVSVWLQEGSQDTAATVQVNLQRRSPDLQGMISAVSADGKVITLEIRKRGEESSKIEIKLTDKTEVEFAGTEKEEEKKLTVGYTGTVWLQEGSKDTAAVFQAAKVKERTR